MIKKTTTMPKVNKFGGIALLPNGMATFTDWDIDTGNDEYDFDSFRLLIAELFYNEVKRRIYYDIKHRNIKE